MLEFYDMGCLGFGVFKSIYLSFIIDIEMQLRNLRLLIDFETPTYPTGCAKVCISNFLGLGPNQSKDKLASLI